ncbi:MAG: hypothetical protein HBSAPP03_16280 [Phycisphaerae bacterium]|nr:MAG: hypothetical protein HBSAPP03_16280 [Phycisphaerae bacterium]
MTSGIPPESIVPHGVPPASWAAIGAEPDNGGWRIPERDADGEIIGWSRRFPDGSKGFVKGGHRGLTMPPSLSAYGGSTEDDPIFVVEGATDAAALHGLGLDAIGRPSAHGGVNFLAHLLRNLHVCIISENDGTAGAPGAFKVADRLKAVCMSVKVIFPPAGVKDAREWVAQGATKEALLAASKDAPQVADSFLPPIEGGREGNEFNPRPVTELGPAAPTNWLWNGYIAEGHVSLLTGYWKAGKSTLLAHVCRDMVLGGGLTEASVYGDILIVSEESESLWCLRRDEVGLPSAVQVGFPESLARMSLGEWLHFIERIRTLARERNYRLVVFDTITNIWPVINENDASQVTAALKPLRALARDGVSVLLIHHPKKNSEGGELSRGSGALLGFVDIIVDFTLAVPNDPNSRRRVLKCRSRFPECPSEVVIELTDAGYVVIGAPSRAASGDRQMVIDGLLVGRPGGLTPDDLISAWPTKPAPSVKTITADLKAGFASGRWRRLGTGRRNDAYRYALASGFVSFPDGVLGEGNESGAGIAAGEVAP